MKQKPSKFITDIAEVWTDHHHLKQLAVILKNNKKILVEQVSSIFEQKKKSDKKKLNEARSFLLRYALTRVNPEFREEHFVFFKYREIVEEILEDFFGVEECRISDWSDPQYYEQPISVIFKDRGKIAKTITMCLELKNDDDIITFLKFFSGDSNAIEKSDKTLRYRSMLWFAFLLTDLIRTDKEACEKGANYIKARLEELLDAAAEGKIVNEKSETGKGDYDGGMWEKSIFSYLQGEDRKPIAERLITQFNFDNEREHANRRLLAEHKRCMYEVICCKD